MKAAIYKKYGPANVLEIADVAKPEPKSNEVLIEVHVGTVNRTDTGLRKANYFISRFFTGLIKPKREAWGSEFAGKVVEVGQEVNNYKVGDTVFGFDDMHASAHAEYMVMRAGGPMAKIPKGLKYAAVAPAGEGATYALTMIDAAKVAEGQKVLVYGASGAIGSAAVQLLNHIGAEVTAVCGTKNVAKVKTLGAHKIVDYETKDFTQTSTRFDFIIDAVGKSSYGVCKKIMSSNGKYCSSELGYAGQNVLYALWFALTGSKKVIFPIPKINKEKIDYIANLLESGDYKPLIDRTYTLDEIAKAAEYVETGQKVGSVVVAVK